MSEKTKNEENKIGNNTYQLFISKLNNNEFYQLNLLKQIVIKMVMLKIQICSLNI